MADGISDSIKSWVSEKIGAEKFSAVKLAGDASARKYFRIIAGEKTWMLMSWEPFQPEDYPFLSVQKHFHACGVRVPEVLAVGEKLGVLLLEDLGDLTLERKFWEDLSPEASSDFYLKTIDELVKIHDVSTRSQIKSTASVTQFDTAKFLWEMNYAKDNLLLGLLKIKLSESTARDLEAVFTHFCAELAAKPKVICHRDFHSRNVMIKRDQVYIIDFQDARLGPVQYDLVSLFKDSYVDMPDLYADKLMDYYLKTSNVTRTPGYSAEEFGRTYDLQTLQRCFKACGSFASFMNMRQDRRYLKYLTPTLKKVLKALSGFPEYSLLNNILLDAGAIEKNYENAL